MVEIIQIDGGPFDSNIFLIRNGDKGVLIDTGSGFYNNSVEDGIRKEGQGMKLVGIILTHEHFDHSGGAKYLMEKFRIPLYASPECARALREADPNLTGSFLFGANMDPIDEIIEISGEVEIGGLGFEVHSTPGHSPGMICIIDKDGRNFFCGDLVFCDGGVGRWDLPGGNLGQLKDFLKTALQWDVKGLYPGHGRVEVKEPKREMENGHNMVEFL